MAKIVVQNDTNADIGIVLTELAGGWRGRCTQCGAPARGMSMQTAVARAQEHVDTHDGEE